MYSNFERRVIRALDEVLAIRSPEVRIRAVRQEETDQIYFENREGRLFNPVAVFLRKPITLRLIKGDDRDAYAATYRQEVHIPLSWVDPSKPHQAIKILHELGHLQDAQEHPEKVRQFIRDFIKVRLLDEYIAKADPQPERIAAFMRDQLNQEGVAIDEAYIANRLSQIHSLGKRNPLILHDMRDELGRAQEVAQGLYERDAWSRALLMARRAAHKGFLVDNRPHSQLFRYIDLYIASHLGQVTADSAIRRRATREELGLANDLLSITGTVNRALY